MKTHLEMLLPCSIKYGFWEWDFTDYNFLSVLLFAIDFETWCYLVNFLKQEELSSLKRQNVSRRLAFDPSSTMKEQENTDTEIRSENDELKSDKLTVCESEGSLGVFSKHIYLVSLCAVWALVGYSIYCYIVVLVCGAKWSTSFPMDVAVVS